MGDIYGEAETVIVWLGEEDRWTKSAMETLQQWANIYRSDLSRLQFTLMRQLVASDVPTSPARGQFEEICLAQRTQIICGSFTCSWSDFRDACAAVIFAGFENLIFEENSNIQTLYDFSTAPTTPMALNPSGRNDQRDLSTLVYRTRLYECSDPRDKIYSLLSVSRPVNNHEQQLQPYYSRSVVNVFQDFTRSRIRANQDLRILSLVKQSSQHPSLLQSAATRGVAPTAGLPSWCPDLRDHDCVEYILRDDVVRGTPDSPAVTRFPQPFMQQYSEEPPTYRVNLDQSCNVKGDITFETLDPSHLGVWGARISTIKHVVCMCTMADDPYVRRFESSTIEQARVQQVPNNRDDGGTHFDKLEHFFHSLSALRRALLAHTFRLLSRYPHTDEFVIMAILRTCAADLLPGSDRLSQYYKKIQFPRHFDWHFWSVHSKGPGFAEAVSVIMTRVNGSDREVVVSGTKRSWSALNSSALRNPRRVYRMYEDLVGITSERKILLQLASASRLPHPALIPLAYLTMAFVVLMVELAISTSFLQNYVSMRALLLVSLPSVVLFTGFRYTLNILISTLKPLVSDPGPPSNLTQYGPKQERNADKEITAEIQNAINRASWNRVFFVTHDGHFDLGPVGTQAGDNVYTLLGGHVPFVLRHVGKLEGCEGSRETYSLLGESYVHGVMDGEFWIKDKRLARDDLDWFKRLSARIVLV